MTNLLPPDAGPITYVCVGVNDFARALRFYEAVMAALGQRRCDTTGESDFGDWAGWGLYERQGVVQQALWICRPFDGGRATPGNGAMVALRARSWDEVRAFHAAALANGGSSEGEPGLRPHYNDDFFAAYVRDPDGNKLAAVCRGVRQP